MARGCIDEAATEPRLRFVNRDLRPGHACVPGEICGCGQSVQPTADICSSFDWAFQRRVQYSRTTCVCHVTCVTVAMAATSDNRTGGPSIPDVNRRVWTWREVGDFACSYANDTHAMQSGPRG